MGERTLVNIKPDAVQRDLVGHILSRIENAGYHIVSMYQTRLSRRQAEAFYAVHQGKPFFEGLIEFMTSGPCIPMVVEGDAVIEGIRRLIGDTDPARAESGTIRAEFGETIRRNCVHASDSPDTAPGEIGFFFSQRELIS